ncbi:MULTISPECIES: acyl-CoA dehydrogenase family protein [unclassified Streptomyces]|uniref:acyl-CoA dehydrogenase family protein n=1 Tax=unclassified Streptomyces TaxID=2593676 RepID=UPI0023670E18|nr:MULTISPECIES: acyl-CoA dehydrogenase family protein [unclassified Streptomyces]MDF3139899.1 acyl-CoA/acyl-ACP dehydrogenase [Streptomyces sp. T21Q-yed]WDF43988.1 acyl-CoA/acyl-ACP dehydrogenase [Streptomyces sp. T12]
MTAPGQIVDDVLTDVLETLRKHAAHADKEASFPAHGMATVRGSGLLGFLVPVEYGGWGGDLSALVRTAQRLGGACLNTATIWAMHCQQVDAVVRYGTRELKEELLPSVARGETYLASITTEAVKGWSFVSAQSPVVPGADGLHLDRWAPVVSGGAHADGFLLTMRAAPDAPSHEVSLVYAGRDQVSVECSGDWDTLGMRGMENVSLKLSGTVPERNLVGGPGGFRTVASESAIPLAHLGLSACWLGAARDVFAQLIGHLRNPRRKGGPTLTSDLVRERLARIRLDLELVHGYLERVTQEVAEVREGAREVRAEVLQIHLNSLKLAASDLSFRAVDRMVELAGLSTGYSSSSPVPLERALRDLRSASLNYSNDRLWTANGALTLWDRSVTLA